MREKILSTIRSMEDRMFSMACDIFDHPESDGKEFYASDLLVKELEELGFAVERGVGGQPTSFRAVWKNGEGGPNIGLLGEYDALPKQGHACGHHMQTPAAIGAAAALKNALEGTDIPVTLTVYGTPAEETYGGKILMAENGCFGELDVAIGTHASRMDAFVGGSSMALQSFMVYFKGRPAHAAGAPWEGRSAGDAMLLSFQGIEFMREHVKDGTRMHYTVKEALGPSNVVPGLALGGYTIRSNDNAYLDTVVPRVKKVIEGACMMTETTCEYKIHPTFAARIPNGPLADAAKRVFDDLSIPTCEDFVRPSGGSTDFGNVSVICPSVMVYLNYEDAPSHSEQWLAAGKTEKARRCLLQSTQATALLTLELLEKPGIIREARADFDRRMGAGK